MFFMTNLTKGNHFKNEESEQPTQRHPPNGQLMHLTALRYIRNKFYCRRPRVPLEDIFHTCMLNEIFGGKKQYQRSLSGLSTNN